jgi:hypothetical protein
MSERISYKLHSQHIGFKMPHTARTYNVTVNHRWQTLYTTDSHPATWNDKTLILFDKFVQGIHDRKILNYLKFELFELNEKGEVVAAKYQGCWLLVDNGYLNWSTTIPRMMSVLTDCWTWLIWKCKCKQLIFWSFSLALANLPCRAIWVTWT